jgi:hypothetical protein
MAPLKMMKDLERGVMPRREYRTFWDWFERQVEREDALGRFVRRVLALPERHGRRLTHLTLHLLVLEYMGGHDDDFELVAECDQQYRRWLDIDGRLWAELLSFRTAILSARTISAARREWRALENIVSEKLTRG